MRGQPKLTARGREPHQLGNAWNTVTGGLFLGVTSVPTTGHFPAPQDQRNTVRGRLRYQAHRISGLAAGYNSIAACHSSSIAIPALPLTSASKDTSRYTARRLSTASTSHEVASILPSS